MEIKISRNDILQELQLIQSIVERKTTMPILANVLFEAKEKHLTTQATDLEVSVASTVSANVLKPGRVTIHARGLYDIVKELPEEIVHMNVKENFWVELHCGKSEFRIVGLAAEEFPSLPLRGEGNSFRVDPTLLSGMIEKSAIAMSTDETRYNLNGVLFEQPSSSEAMRMVATDGHRLSLVDRMIQGKVKFPRGVILPRKGVTELGRLLENGDGDVELWFGDKHLIAYRGKISLSIRLIDGQFPPYEQVMPKKAKRIVSVEREAMVRALRRVLAMTTDRTRGVKFSFSPKNLEVSVSHPDFGEAREELGIQYKGDAFEIGFNGRYFLEALSVLEDTTVALQLGDDTTPCLIESELDRGFKHVIMPMRL